MQAIIALLLIPIYLMLFLVFGQGFYLLFHRTHQPIGHKIIIGFFTYFSIFQMVALPLKIILAPLSALSILWAVIVIIVVIMVCVISLKGDRIKLEIGSGIKGRFKIKRINLIYIMVILAIIGVQFIVIELNQSVGSPWDASYYIGEVVSSVYTNTISQYDAYTGLKLSVLNSSYLLENYQMHSAIASQIFHIHPLLEMRTTMSGVIVLLTNLILVRIGRMLFPKQLKKTALFVLFIAIFNICYASFFSAAFFYSNRTFEGKTILSATIFPATFYLVFRLMINYERKKNVKHTLEWAELFILVFGTFCINMSAMFLMPVLLSSLLIPFALIKRRWAIFKNYIISLIPCVIVMIYYLMTSHGYGLFYIK